MSARVGVGEGVDGAEDGSDSIARKINQLFLFRASALLFGASWVSTEGFEGPATVQD